MDNLIFFAISVLCCAPDQTEAAYKRWIKNTDFDNPSNWNTGSLPCPKDRIIFPSVSPIVSINQDWTINHMVICYSNNAPGKAYREMAVNLSDIPIRFH